MGEVVAGPDAEDTMAVGGKQLHGRTWVRTSPGSRPEVFLDCTDSGRAAHEACCAESLQQRDVS